MVTMSDSEFAIAAALVVSCVLLDTPQLDLLSTEGAELTKESR